jgi:hypothetical protein
MELQAIAGLQRGFCDYRSLGRTGRISSGGVAPKLWRSGLLGGSWAGRSGGGGAVTVRCRSGGESAEAEGKKVSLKKGSAVVVTEAPPLLKTAEPMPMMRPNNGLINVGDAGR